MGEQTFRVCPELSCWKPTYDVLEVACLDELPLEVLQEIGLHLTRPVSHTWAMPYNTDSLLATGTHEWWPYFIESHQVRNCDWYYHFSCLTSWLQQALKRFSLISKNVRAAALPLLFKSISLTYGEEKWLGPRNAKFDPVVWTHVVWTHVKVVRLEVSQRSIRKLSTEKKSGHWQIWMNYWQLLLSLIHI